MLTAEVSVRSELWWYVARASGLVSWVLLLTAVVWGMSFAGRMTKRRPPAAWVLDLHRFLGGLAVVFVGVHLTALAADTYVSFGWRELFVPMASTWRPGAVAWGIVALYVLLAIEITSLLMKRLPRRVWHAVHLSSFGLAALATVHGLTAGADAGHPAVRVALAITALVMVVVSPLRLGLPALRARRKQRVRDGRRVTRPPATAVTTTSTV